jgi:hypothetical protein
MYGLAKFSLLLVAFSGAALALVATERPAPVTPAVEAAAPVALEARATSQLSVAQINGYAPYTQLARAAYCSPAKITGWKCGRKYISTMSTSTKIDRICLLFRGL